MYEFPVDTSHIVPPPTVLGDVSYEINAAIMYHSSLHEDLVTANMSYEERRQFCERMADYILDIPSVATLTDTGLTEYIIEFIVGKPSAGDLEVYDAYTGDSTRDGFSPWQITVRAYRPMAQAIAQRLMETKILEEVTPV